MPIYSKVNQYLGVNAHANSWLQVNRAWHPFHFQHIVNLTDAVNNALPDGYIAVPQPSLQIEFTMSEEADPYFPHLRRARGTLVPTIETVNMIDPDSELNAVIVYQTDDQPRYGRPVARIELLSPTNKPPYSGAQQYERSRVGALSSRIPLVEIDYLNRQRSVNAAIPRYPQDNGSQPYSITIHDPRPSLYDGTSDVILFGVDDPIPVIQIPLASGAVTGQIALGAAYHQSFRSAVQLHRQVDYEQPPIDFAQYSARDQAKILRRLEIVQTKQSQGISLADGPFVE